MPIINGPGDSPWFRMTRTNGGFLSFGETFNNCHFVITNNAGEPFVAMQEQFSWRNYVYELYRFDSN